MILMCPVWQSGLLYVDADADGFDGDKLRFVTGPEIPVGYAIATNGSEIVMMLLFMKQFSIT